MTTLDVNVRGITIRFSVSNPRLRVWAERFEEIEPELLDFIDVMSERAVFYDAGASIGLFSLYAAIKRRARVVAFEPEAQNFGTLEYNHFLNKAALTEDFQAFNVALSDSKGVGRIYTRNYGSGEHVKILDVSETRDTHEPFVAEHVQSVLRLPLDAIISEYSLEPPDVLKIDVDGSEALLLAGAGDTLRNPRLKTVFIELTDPAASEELGILQRHGFRLAQQHPVVRLSGGYYPGLFNCIVTRD